MVKSCFCRCEMYSDVCIEMKILILYSAIGSMATVDSALFSSSAIRVIKMVVLPLLYISLNLSLAKLVMWNSIRKPAMPPLFQIPTPGFIKIFCVEWKKERKSIDN